MATDCLSYRQCKVIEELMRIIKEDWMNEWTEPGCQQINISITTFPLNSTLPSWTHEFIPITVPFTPLSPHHKHLLKVICPIRLSVCPIRMYLSASNVRAGRTRIKKINYKLPHYYSVIYSYLYCGTSISPEEVRVTVSQWKEMQFYAFAFSVEIKVKALI